VSAAHAPRGSHDETAEPSMARHYLLVILVQVVELAALAWLAARFR
jgi:hypothetical protein